MLKAYVAAQFGNPDAQPVVTDVAAALGAVRADAVHPGFGPNTSQSCKFHFDPDARIFLTMHLQGIARLSLPGFEHWFLASKHHEDPAKAGILCVEWSRLAGKGGELVKALIGGSAPGIGETRVKMFGASDHPGGIQICGRILAVAQSRKKHDYPWIDFVNVENPATPSLQSRLRINPDALGSKSVTSVALTRVEDGRYVCFVYRYSSRKARRHCGLLYVSDGPTLTADTKWDLETAFGSSSFPKEWHEPYENINFVGQSDGSLFLAGMRGFETDNHVDVFRFSERPYALKFYISKPVHTASAGASFRAGGSLYVTPAGKLAIYAVQKVNNATAREVVIEEFSDA
jgi:hypothetical protein